MREHRTLRTNRFHLKQSAMAATLPEASTLDVVPDQLPLVLHPEALLHEDDPVFEDDDVREVKSVGDVVGKEPLPNVLWALVFTEEEPVFDYSMDGKQDSC